MADRLDLNPTKGNLLRLKDELDSLRSRHELLERKREVLVQDLMKRSERAKTLEKKMQERFAGAHEALREARVRTGSDRLQTVAAAPNAKAAAKVSFTTVMGIRIPKTRVDVDDQGPGYGPEDTGPAVDLARTRWIEVLEFLSDTAGVYASLWRLATDLRKTRRQVNALQSTIIPRHENTIAFIQERLDEEEREDILHAKKIKEKRG